MCPLGVKFLWFPCREALHNKKELSSVIRLSCSERGSVPRFPFVSRQAKIDTWKDSMPSLETFILKFLL